MGVESKRHATKSADRGVFASLQPIPKIDLTDEVVRRFKQLLADGRLKRGGRLPPERELAGLFGISRPSLRHGLKALEMLGAIESRRRQGTFVSESAGNVLEEPLNLVVLLNPTTFEELYEVRRIVEVELAALAAERASARELADIEQCLGEQRVSTGTDFLAKHLEFHNYIARASHNSLITIFLGSLRRLMSDKMKLLLLDAPGLDISSNVAKTVEQHDRIVRRLFARDPAGAREAMRDHLQHVYSQWVSRAAAAPPCIDPTRSEGPIRRTALAGCVPSLAGSGKVPVEILLDAPAHEAPGF
jgi:GntR family transcriptional repressor for pyruvate dehydrogenase complex